jgi:hypothetical protein
MRILLDECMPRRLKRELPGHDVRTVPEAGWAGRTNGDLLRLAAEHFDVFLTVDRGLPHQQPVERFDIAIVVLVARGNGLVALRPPMPAVRARLGSLRPGGVAYISGLPEAEAER